jgi:hypothetical protein
MRNELYLPTKALADAAVAEWEAVGEVIDPAAMPMTALPMLRLIMSHPTGPNLRRLSRLMPKAMPLLSRRTRRTARA